MKGEGVLTVSTKLVDDHDLIFGNNHILIEIIFLKQDQRRILQSQLILFHLLIINNVNSLYRLVIQFLYFMYTNNTKKYHKLL